MREMDAIVIGSGQGGVPLATKLASRGNDVVLFERDQLGGTCVNYGCLPSKAFLAAAHAAAAARNSAKLGVHANVTVDFQRVMAHAREAINSSRNAVPKRLEDAGVTLVKSEASFKDRNVVSADGTDYRASLIIVDTGASPASPPIEGLDEVDAITYESFWELERLPERTVVVGGGYTGLELGQGLARLGSDTTIVERESRLIVSEEKDVSEELRASLERDGITILTSTEVSTVSQRSADSGHSDNRGAITVQLSSADEVETDLLLIASGRKPNTDALNLDAAGIEVDDDGYIKVDQQLRTSNHSVFAMGDVIGQKALTPISWEDHRRILDILDSGNRTQGDRTLAYAFFTQPEVGRVGLTEEQANSQGYRAKSATILVENVVRSSLSGYDMGFYRMVVDEDTDKILGATMVGPMASELIHVLMAHIEAGSTWQVLERSMHAHPTFAEGLPALAREFAD